MKYKELLNSSKQDFDIKFRSQNSKGFYLKKKFLITDFIGDCRSNLHGYDMNTGSPINNMVNK
ncbi:hypothetical protein DSECCO2_189930 [anaerobic digester metagenome]